MRLNQFTDVEGFISVSCDWLLDNASILSLIPWKLWDLMIFSWMCCPLHSTISGSVYLQSVVSLSKYIESVLKVQHYQKSLMNPESTSSYCMSLLFFIHITWQPLVTMKTHSCRGLLDSWISGYHHHACPIRSRPHTQRAEHSGNSYRIQHANNWILCKQTIYESCKPILKLHAITYLNLRYRICLKCQSTHVSQLLKSTIIAISLSFSC